MGVLRTLVLVYSNSSTPFSKVCKYRHTRIQEIHYINLRKIEWESIHLLNYPVSIPGSVAVDLESHLEFDLGATSKESEMTKWEVEALEGTFYLIRYGAWLVWQRYYDT